MADVQVNGLPAVVQNNLPVAHNIMSTTNATPIVVTTTTDHGLTTGDYLTIAGADDANANGDFIAGTVTPDTVSLQIIPTGANRAGAGGGGANGTLQSLSFGLTYPIPGDGADGMTASSVNVPFSALGDRTAYLLYRVNKDNTYLLDHVALDTVAALAQGDPDSANDGDFKFYGQLTIFDNGSDIGGFTAKTNTTISMESGAFFDLRCASQERAPVSLSDAAHTIDSSSGGNRFLMRTSPAANRVITLRQSTSPVPRNGDWYEFTVFLGLSIYTVALQREGSLDYVAVLGDGTNTNPYGLSNLVATARVQLDGGVWRLVSVGGAKAFSSTDS